MRVLLWNESKRSFYKDPDTWTTEPASALNFDSSLTAALFARDNDGEELEICLDFGDPEYNVYLPVHARLGT